jgi:hypothetical protein
LLILLLAETFTAPSVPFRRNVGFVLTLLSAIAIAWLGVTSAIVPACISP